jgi:SNF2 family DNA or RNA helicase
MQAPTPAEQTAVLMGLLDSTMAMLDDAEGLSPIQRAKLSSELLKLRKVLAAPDLRPLERAKASARLLGIRKQLGVHVSKVAAPVEPAPAPEAAPATPEVDVEFGLRASGVKTRERINAKTRDIVERAQREGLKLSDLTPEERETIAQFSGRGGLTENSQSEYHTPVHIAAGSWELLAANGFTNGNVLEPSAGAGVFSSTKPKGVVISGAEIEPTSAAVAQLLHPEDKITNTSFERLALSTADNTFDAVAGNVPFGVRGKEGHHDGAWKHEKRMERYFVRRVLDKVRPGGLVTLIVPTSVIGKKDNTWAKWRTDISMYAEFLGGHKLPSKTFGKQGTDVVTDIIVLRKHPAELLEKIDKLSVQTLRDANVLWPEFIEGRYWQGEGIRFIHGQFVPGDPNAARSEDKVIAPEDLTEESMKRRLAAKFDSRIDWAMLDAAQVVTRAYAEGDRKVINGQQMEMQAGQWVPFTPTEPAETVLDPAQYGVAALSELESLLNTPEGMLSLTADQAFKAWKKYPHLFNGLQSQAVEFAISQPADKYRDVAYRGSLLGSMVTKYAIGEDATDRDRVIRMLQDEVAKYGHPSTIKGMVLDGAKAQAFGSYLSAIDSAGAVSAVVRGEVEKAKGFVSDNILSIVQHLMRESGNGIEVADIAALYNGPRTLKELGDIGDVTGIAITANGFVMTTGAYCCGDVYSKVAELQNAQSGATDPRLKAHWTALIEHMMGLVKRTDVSSIGFGLRDNWIAADYKMEFLRLNGFGQLRYIEDATSEEAVGEDGEEVEPSRTGGVWVYRGQDEFSKQLVHYLSGRSIGHNLKDRKGSSADERRVEFQEKVQGMEEQFKFFMQAHSDGADLAATYDMTFNRHVTPDYDKSDLGLKGVSAGVRLHWYQNAGVRRLSEEGSGILGHDVGLGKTFGSLAFSTYDRQMGRSKKHCFVVPKSVLANWYMESKKMFGKHDGVLFVGFEPKRKKDGSIVQEPVLDENNQPKKNQHTGELEFQDVLVEDTPAEVFAKMHSIPAMGDGLVIMTQEKFKTIPLKPETVEAYGDKWVKRSMASSSAMQKLAGKDVKEGSYAKQKEQAGLENEFYGEGTKKKDELPYFEDMGFDRVVVDEAHHYKASFQIKQGMDKLAYLPNPAESQRAQDMALKLSHVRDQNGGKGSILLTATPVSNSPIEIFNVLMNVVPPEELDKLGIYTPADFVRFFGRLESVQKLTVAGVVEPRDGLKGFRNLNILRGLFNRYANMMGAKDVDPEGTVLKLPEAQEVKSQCDMTATQQDLYVTLRAEAKDSGNPKKVAAGEARPMFAVLRDMDRVTTDIDLYRKTMTFLFKAEEEPRVKALIDALPATVMREEMDEDTQEKVKVPVEKVTAYRIVGDTLTYVAPDVYEEAVASRLKKFNIGYASHPLTPKYAELVKNLKAELATGGKQLIFTEEKSQHGKLERLLVENLPEDEARIGIINADTASGEKLQEIVDAYTRGEYTIIICNKKAEVGVNLQRGTTAVHHMTLPWTPASIQQRNGRAVRQGNKVASVRIYYYQAKGSFDEYRLDLLSKKASWIGALLSKDNTDDEHDNENAESEIEQAALLSDDREQFLAALAAQQAKKDAETKERRDNAAKVGLNQLSAARGFIATFDARKAKAIAEQEGEVEKAKASLQRAIANPDPDPAKQKQIVARREGNVNWEIRKLAGIAPTMDQKKADAESRARQITGTLKAQASRGELPFKAELIDAPEESVMALNKVVVYKGGIYEVEGKYAKNILRVVGVNAGAREIQVEYIAKGSQSEYAPDGTYDVDKIVGTAGREVHFSDEEIQVRKLIATPIKYANIGERVSKDVFLANLTSIKVMGYALHRIDGTLEGRYGGSASMVYPDKSDKSLRQELAALYGNSLSGSGGLDGVNEIMPAVFGNEWRGAVAEYIKVATDEDIRTKAMELIRAVVPAVLSTVAEADAAYAKLTDLGRTYLNTGPELDALNGWADQAGYVNKSEIRNEFKDIARTQANAVTEQRYALRAAEDAKARAAADEAERLRQREAASDVRFKELTDQQVKRFTAMNMRATFNNADKAPNFPPFGGFYVVDTKAQGGILYRMKEIMKGRFGAKWSGKPLWDARFNNSWTFPATIDVDALLTFLED